MQNVCTGWAKKRGTLLFPISSPIIDLFSKFFHWHTQNTPKNSFHYSTIHGRYEEMKAIQQTTLWAIKNMALYFCQYLCRLLTNFQNFFTGTLCRQFAITWLLHIPPHHKCISTLLCEISCIHNDNNKHFGKIEKKHCRPTLQWMICTTLDCVGLTHSLMVWSVF